MKLRKHKSNKTFVINFRTSSTKVIANKGNVGGWEQREQVLGPYETACMVSHDRASALKGFLWGRDQNNTVVTRIAQL